MRIMEESPRKILYKTHSEILEDLSIISCKNNSRIFRSFPCAVSYHRSRVEIKFANLVGAFLYSCLLLRPLGIWAQLSYFQNKVV